MEKSDEEIAEIFKAHDTNGDGGIDFNEFKTLFVEEGTLDQQSEAEEIKIEDQLDLEDI